MTRSLTVFALALAGAMLVAVSVQAQPNDGQGQRERRMGGPGMAMPGMGIGLLRLEQVEKDLKLTDDQKAKLRALGREMRDNREAAEKKIAEILTPEQLDRFKQIRLQMEGIAALVEARVVKALALTDDQVSKLKAMQGQVREKMREASQGLRDLTPEEQQAKMKEMRVKMQEMRKEVMDKALEVLTPEQREKLEKMKGAKIEVNMFPPGRGQSR
jgi:Spy/CpxP family protein refolding chaperone